MASLGDDVEEDISEEEDEDDEKKHEDGDASELEGNDQFAAGKCRMYEKEYPEADELVLVQVKNVAETGAYVSLLEYNNIEGMILLSELSRRRIRSMNKVIRVGRTEVVVVLRVDREKGYIDLSKRRVNEEETEKCEAKYAMSKQVHSIMSYVAGSTKTPLLKLYETFGWDLYRRFGHAYEAFKLIVSGDLSPLDKYKDLSPQVVKTLTTVIGRRLAPQPFKIRADVEVTCFAYEGIDAIKAALKEGEQAGSKEVPVKIKLLAPPLYIIESTCTNKDLGLKTLETVIEKISAVLKAKEGHIVVKEAPRVVSEHDDRKLQDEMRLMEEENRQVAGDEPEDD